ncbi:MAG: adenylate/guanylate cyclase domain-containing protein [Pseudomonadota bacterium]
MSETPHIKFTESIARQIADSRQQVSILFTDIEYSTLHWDVLGDVDGRLMVDQHNRLLFPVIKRFRGKIIKTIGDAIMASFKTPDGAVNAAIGIQQILSQARSQKGGVTFSVRIGIHTGTGIVEHSDIFGDVVNVAAKIQSRCLGDEILLTGSTVGALDAECYELNELQGFVPKGKQELISVFSCEWRNHWNLVNDIEPRLFLSISTRDKIDILIYTIVSIGIGYFLYLKYLRYIIADYEALALLSLNPSLLLHQYPSIVAALTAVTVLAGIWVFHIHSIPHIIYKLLKGMYGFCIGFLAIYILVMPFSMDFLAHWDKKIIQSRHLFVRVMEDGTRIHSEPSKDTPVLITVNAGTLLLLTDLADQEIVTWNKVLIAHQTDAWVRRVVPAKLGSPEKRVTITERFYVSMWDLAAMFSGSMGFIWGMLSFRVRPI